jgi:hypothetical protein
MGELFSNNVLFFSSSNALSRLSMAQNNGIVGNNICIAINVFSLRYFYRHVRAFAFCSKFLFLNHAKSGQVHIWVEREEGKGTIFSFALPLIPTAQEEKSPFSN